MEDTSSSSSSFYEEEALVLAQAAVTAVQSILQERRRRKETRPRSCWVKSWKSRREVKSSYWLLTSELKLEDRDAFRNFIRMNYSTFNSLVQIVEHDLQRQDTHLRKAVTVREKLAATLRFLSTGESYKSLEYQTRLSISFLSNEIPKVCDVLYQKLKGTNLKVVKKRNFNSYLHLLNKN